MTPILPPVSGPTTGAETRELLTGTTYAARTEGAGYLRDVAAVSPASGAGRAANYGFVSGGGGAAGGGGGAVSSVFGRTGAVTAAVGDYTVAQVTGAVPSTRTILSGHGLTGGGDLTGDRTLAVLDDSTTQRIGILSAGVTAGTRPALNFIAGSNVTITAADNAGSNRVDVTIASTGGGTPASPSGSVQFNNAGAFGGSANLVWDNANGRLGVGTTSPATPLDVVSNPSALGMQLRGRSDGWGTFQFASNDGATVLAALQADPASYFYIHTAGSQRVTVTNVGNVGIGMTNPTYKLDVTGDIHASGYVFANAVYAGSLAAYLNTQTVPPSGAGLYVAWNRSNANAEVNFYNVYENAGTAFVFSAKTGPSTYKDVLTIAGNGAVSGLGVGGPMTQSVVTGSRALGTVYQNTSGRPMLVCVTPSASTTGYTAVQAVTDSATTPTTVVAYAAGMGAVGIISSVTFWVLPNNYYKVVSTGSSCTLALWTEWY